MLCRGDVEAHHIIFKGQCYNAELKTHVDNGLLLCDKHHRGSSDLSAHRTKKLFNAFIERFMPDVHERVERLKEINTKWRYYG